MTLGSLFASFGGLALAGPAWAGPDGTIRDLRPMSPPEIAEPARVVGGDAWRVAWAAPPADDPPPRTAPGVDVYGERPAPETTEVPLGGGGSPTGLAEDTRLGPYGQPEWTTDRRWARVRAYVLAPGQVEAETWYRGRIGRKDEDTRHVFQQEIEIGLPHRFQLDFYLNFQDDHERELSYRETQVEARWALANWGCLWANPTLYLEYKLHDHEEDADTIEAKLLLADDLACRWRWGANFVYERELSGEKEEVLGFTAALSYTLIDQRLDVGAEFQIERATVAGARDDAETTMILGPSLQVRLSKRTHLDFAPLFALTEEGDRMQIFIVFGIDLSPGGSDGGWLNPIAARSR